MTTRACARARMARGGATSRGAAAHPTSSRGCTRGGGRARHAPSATRLTAGTRWGILRGGRWQPSRRGRRHTRGRCTAGRGRRPGGSWATWCRRHESTSVQARPVQARPVRARPARRRPTRSRHLREWNNRQHGPAPRGHDPRPPAATTTTHRASPTSRVPSASRRLAWDRHGRAHLGVGGVWAAPALAAGPFGTRHPPRAPTDPDLPRRARPFSRSSTRAPLSRRAPSAARQRARASRSPWAQRASASSSTTTGARGSHDGPPTRVAFWRGLQLAFERGFDLASVGAVPSPYTEGLSQSLDFFRLFIVKWCATSYVIDTFSSSHLCYATSPFRAGWPVKQSQSPAAPQEGSSFHDSVE